MIDWITCIQPRIQSNRLRVTEPSHQKSSDPKKKMSDVIHSSGSHQVRVLEKQGQKVGMRRTADKRVAGGTGDQHLEPMARSDHVQHSADFRPADPSNRDRSEKLGTIRAHSSQLDSQPSIPTDLSSQAPIVDQAARVQASVQLTSLSHSRGVSTTPDQDLSSVPASQRPQSPSDPPRYSKSQRDRGDIRQTTSQMQGPVTFSTRSPSQSSGRQQDASTMSRPSATRPAGSVDTPQTAREALLSAIAKTTPAPNKGVPSSGHASVNPSITTETSLSQAREAIALEQFAKAGGLSEVNPSTASHQHKSKSVQPESLQMESPPTSSRIPSFSTAAASLTQQLNTILSSSTKPVAHVPELSNPPTRSQIPEGTPITAAASTTMIRQLQGQLQKLLSTSKPMEQEIPISITSPPIPAPQPSRLTVISHRFVKDSGIPDGLPPNLTPQSKAEETIQPSSVIVSVDSNVRSVINSKPPISSQVSNAGQTTPRIHTVVIEDTPSYSTLQIDGLANTRPEIPFAARTKISTLEKSYEVCTRRP